MSEKPILFSGPMVQAILDGRKTQTRRVVKNLQRLEGLMLKGEEGNWCPYGKVGDLLWVKEDYKYLIQGDLVLTYYKYSINKNRAGYTPLNCLDEKTREKLAKGRQEVWKSKLLMFKFMARLWLEITGIRVERVQEITWRDCKAEGITLIGDELVFNNQKQKQTLMRTKFERLWDSLNAKHSWDKNPWVWVIEFKRVKD